jgi:RNA recognition motif-containing protein
VNIYVGNLSYETTSDELKTLFSEFGEVASASVITDKYTGQSKGFGFVEMPSREQAQAAISGLSGREHKGRTMNVNEARPREDRGPRGGGRGGGHGKGGGGRRY